MFGDYLDRYEIASCSDNEGSYSDQIDSDVEAELYGLIHHQENEELSKETPSKNVFNSINNSNHEKCLLSSNENSFVTDVSFLQLFTSHESSSKIPVSPFKSPNVEKAENISPIRLNNTSVNSLISNNMNKHPDEGISMKRKIDSLIVHEEKNQKKISIESKTLNLTDRNNHVDSSDSDDIIIFEPNSYEHLKINVSEQDIIELSSDESSDTNMNSSTSNMFEPKMNSKMSTSFSNSQDVETTSDLWQINNEDLYRSAKKSKFSNRYHDRMSRKCTNCNEMGHAARSCTLPQQRKCFICGGKHSAYSCDSAICSICYKKGHNSRRCWRDSEEQPCSSCNMFGHTKKNCPDIWRRYHLTTSNSEIIKGRLLEQSVPLYCFNCGVEGHFGSECPRPRMQSFESSYPTWPLVISYDDLYEIPTKDNNHSKRSSEKSPNLNMQSNQKFKQKPKKKKPKKNLNFSHQNYKEMEQMPKVNRKARKNEFQKKPLRQENDQTPVRQSVFSKSPKNINFNYGRLNTSHFPKSSPVLRQNPRDSFSSIHQKNKVLAETKRKERQQQNMFKGGLKNQMLLRETDFPRSLRKNKSNVEDDRMNRTTHLPSSSEMMPSNDIPYALVLAEKRRIKRREKRKRRQIRMMALMKSDTNKF